jgi:preprotein translocase subunit SecA
MQWILKKIIGTKNERDLKKLRPLVDRINELDEEYKTLSDNELKNKTDEFKKRLADGASLDDIMCEAFASVKNACRRLIGYTFTVSEHDYTWDMVPFDVQIIGGITLHQGNIAEMATGEGKTLVATMPAYLNALSGKSVHIVTFGDFLARRDAQWMAPVYEYLGLKVGCIQNQMRPEVRRREYASDIVYGANSEFGFDYLRDMGMAYHPEEQVQRGHYFAIVDEVDSLLIDEARTPLIISGPSSYSTTQYKDLNHLVNRLVRRQRDLCNGYVQEVKKLLEEEKEEEAQLRLYQIHQGMPKNKQFLHLLEEPKVRRMMEKINDAMLTDMRKDEARTLREELYFTIDEKGHDANLTEKGSAAMSPNDPEAFMLPDLISSLAHLDGQQELSEKETMAERQRLQDEFTKKSESIHCVDQLIRAYCVYEKEVDYVVQNNQVLIVDEFTGRLMPGRRWSDGLHQAVEAKEGVTIERETQTLATITVQNYFRMYEKLAGMTGTAETEADEFHQIYGLDVVVIPTNRPVRRVNFNDPVYKTQREKYNAIINEIETCHKRGQPVLVGTISVDTSELISRMLRRENIPHNVLNAKNHAREAEIVARAGQKGAVTIATNMAGRGTDIKLGEGVVYVDRDIITSNKTLDDKHETQTLKQLLMENPCGLHVIGTERHEARRIDRQLRGRCARQGDPGTSRFYVSLEDNLMRLFGSERISGIMEKLGIQEGEVLEHPWLNRSIETAQRRVEQHNFSIRKRTLEYDDVMNMQREVIYGFRSEVVSSEKVRPHLLDIVEDVIHDRALEIPSLPAEEGTFSYTEWINTTFPIGLKESDLKNVKDDPDKIAQYVGDRIHKAYELKVEFEDKEKLEEMERFLILQSIDTHWQEYLRSMDALREGVGLRAYGQRDPLVEYKKEAFGMFSDLMDRIKEEVCHKMFRSATSMDSFSSFMAALPQTYVHDEISALSGRGAPVHSRTPPPSKESPSLSKGIPVKREHPKVGRNDPCPCGSGKKYKKCCGRTVAV